MSLPTQPEFEDLVNALMSPDNVYRKQAEGFYDKLREENPQWLVMAHLSIIKAGNQENSRYMCTILLRRMLDPMTKLLRQFGPDVVMAIKSDLVDLFQRTDLARTVRKGITGCMAMVIESLAQAKNDSWSDVIPFLLEASERGNSDIRLACILVFKQVATCLVDHFMSSQYITPFCTAMSRCLQDSSHGVRVATVEAVSQFVAVMDEKDVEKFRPLIPFILQSMQNTMQEGDQESVGYMMDPLVYIADNNVEFYGSHIGNVVDVMMHIASTEGLKQALHTYAVEFMLAFCERAPKIARSVPKFVRGLFELCLRFSSFPSSESNWETTYEENENPDEISDYDIGMEGLDRMACALKGKTIEPLATEFILSHSNSPRWELRQGALMCIGQIAEGCHDAFLSNINNIVTLCLNHINDDHPRVRYAAIASLAQLFTDFGDELSECYDRMVPAVISRLQDRVPRIQAIAAAAICNFTDSADVDDVKEYASELLRNTVELLNHTNYIFIREQCLAAIAAVAENCGEAFGEFCDRLVPILKPILDIPETKENRIAKCRALEAVTLMAVSVGKEKFGADARGICDYLEAQQNVHRENDDPFIRYIIRGWGCMAKCLKRDFAPWLRASLGPALKILEQEVSMDVVGEHEDVDEEEEGVQVICLSIKGLGDRKVKLHTALIEDKTLAMGFVLSAVEETEDAILPYMDEIVRNITNLLEFPYTDEVRICSAQCAAVCVKTARAFSLAHNGAHDAKNVDLSSHFMREIFKALRKECETVVATDFLASIHVILEHTPSNFIPPQALEEVTNIMKQVFDEGIKRRHELFAEMEGEDDEDLDAIMEEHEDEENLMVEAIDVVGRLLKTQDAFFSVFTTEFLPKFAELLDERAGNMEHKLALCVLDDFLEIKPEAALQYFNHILGAMMKYSCDPDMEVRQAASFGVGLCAELMEKTPSIRDSETGITMARNMLSNLNTPPEASDAYLHTTANVAATTMKLLRVFANELRDKEDMLLSAVVRVLPLQNDWKEAQLVHRVLTQMMQGGHPILKREEKTILTALRKCMDTDLLDEDTKKALS